MTTWNITDGRRAGVEGHAGAAGWQGNSYDHTSAKNT
jgi:hypothetical protein